MQFVLNELKSARQYVDARRRRKQQVDISRIVSGFADSLIKKINSHHLNSVEIAKIMEELDNSPYGDDQTCSIIQLLDSKVLEGMAESDSQGTADQSRSKQHKAVASVNKSTLLSWHNYFGNDDFDKFGDALRSWYVTSEHAACKSRSFGCVDPCEQSVKHLFALLLMICLMR